LIQLTQTQLLCVTSNHQHTSLDFAHLHLCRHLHPPNPCIRQHSLQTHAATSVWRKRGIGHLPPRQGIITVSQHTYVHPPVCCVLRQVYIHLFHDWSLRTSEYHPPGSPVPYIYSLLQTGSHGTDSGHLSLNNSVGIWWWREGGVRWGSAKNDCVYE